MFLKNKNIFSKIRRSKVTDYAALKQSKCYTRIIGSSAATKFGVMFLLLLYRVRTVISWFDSKNRVRIHIYPEIVIGQGSARYFVPMNDTIKSGWSKVYVIVMPWAVRMYVEIII